ncbi:MAG: ABC transporter permease [Melioribacteraceae bacterium]
MPNRKLVRAVSTFSTYLLTIFLLISVVFILVRLSPGDPTLKYLSPQFNPQLHETVKNNYGLDKSVGEQYLRFLVNIAHGNLGVSYTYREPVQSIILEKAPLTLFLAIISFVLQIAVSVGLVQYLHQHRGKWLERALNKISLIMYALPPMVVGIGLIFIFSIVLKMFPIADVVSTNFDQLNYLQKTFDLVKHFTLPIITLSLPGIIIYYNYIRENVVATEKQTFVKFLFANGFENEIIFKKHVLPNSINPLISILGTELGILLGGAIITESLFGLPGLGRLTVTAIITRDYPLVVGCVLLTGFFVLLVNFIADLYKIKRDIQLSQSINISD